MSYINAHITPGTTEAKGNWVSNCPGFLAGAKYVRFQMARKQRQTHSLLTAHTKAKQKSQKGKRSCDLQPSRAHLLLLLIRLCVISCPREVISPAERTGKLPV